MNANGSVSKHRDYLYSLKQCLPLQILILLKFSTLIHRIHGTQVIIPSNQILVVDKTDAPYQYSVESFLTKRVLENQLK